VQFMRETLFVMCHIADPKIPTSGFDVIFATTIGRDDILPSGILCFGDWDGNTLR
jgi:hypothetical protein